MSACRVPVEKVRDYLLNPKHQDGGPKSAFFQALGFRRSRYEQLTEALVQHFAENEPYTTIETEYGTKLIVNGPLPSPDGRRPTIKSVWIKTAENPVPTFITAVPR